MTCSSGFCIKTAFAFMGWLQALFCRAPLPVLCQTVRPYLTHVWGCKGHIPDTWVSKDGLPGLTELFLNGNNLSGSLQDWTAEGGWVLLGSPQSQIDLALLWMAHDELVACDLHCNVNTRKASMGTASLSIVQGRQLR